MGRLAPLDLPFPDRAAIVAALTAIAAVCWIYTYRQVGVMADMAEIAMPVGFGPWTAEDFALNIAIWWVMMLGMMVPSAAAMVLVFAAINRAKRSRGPTVAPISIFTAGYAIAWGIFGLAATFTEWGLEQAALISPETQRVSPVLGAAIVIAAGLYQLTPLKYACLAKCRSPFDFVLNHWRDGTAGALRMGLEHGWYCLACCWLLMALLFAVGVMNLLWMGALTGFVLIEKLFPAGQWIARAGGFFMLALGVYLLTQS